VPKVKELRDFFKRAGFIKVSKKNQGKKTLATENQKLRPVYLPRLMQADCSANTLFWNRLLF